MRHGVATLLFILLFGAIDRATPTVTFTPTSPGQASPQCSAQPTAAPIMYLCIDWVDPSSGTIAGWAVDLRTHQAPTGWFLLDPAGDVAPLPFTVARPDVQAAFDLPTDAVGFGIVLGPMADGFYGLQTSDVPWAWDCWLTDQGMVCDWVAAAVVFTVAGQ